jgi:hypothetical protein
LPDLVGSELGEGRHGRAVDAVADVQEELAIGIAVAEEAGGQGRAAASAIRNLLSVLMSAYFRSWGAPCQRSTARFGIS